MGAAAVIEEILASFGTIRAGAAAAGEGAEAAGARLNDLERATGSVTKTTDLYNKKLKEGLDVVRELYEEIKQLKEGASKYNPAVEKLTDATATIYFGLKGLSDLVKGDLPAAGQKLLSTIGAVNGLFKEFAQKSLIQQDLLVKSYQSLSQFGAIDPTGLRGLLTSLEDIGTTPENAQYFIEALSKASEQMVMFGGTVAEGAYGITQIIKAQLEGGKEYEGQLNQFGYTTQEITKYTTSFISQISRNAYINTTDTENLRKRTFDYMVNLQELSELTGQSRDSLQEQIEEQQRDIAFRLYLRKLGQEEGGDKKVENVMLAIAGIQNKAAQQALKESLATGGAIVSATGAMQQDVVRNSLIGLKQVEKGTLDVTSFVNQSNQDIANKTNKRLDLFGSSIQYAGAEARQVADALTITTNTIDSARKGGGDLGKVKDATAAALAQQEERLRVETERRKIERQVSVYYQELSYAVGNLAVPATKYLAEAALAGAKALDKFYGNMDVLNEARKRAPFENESERLAANKAVQESLKNEPSPNSPLYDSWKQSHDLLVQQAEEAAKSARNRDEFLRQERLTALDRARQEAEKLRQLELERQERVREENRSRTSASLPNPRDTATIVDARINKIVDEFKKIHPDTRLTSTTSGDHVPGSTHYTGRGADIAFSKKISDLEYETYKKQLQDLGATNIRNEMEKPKGPAGRYWTGPHIHFEVPERPVGPNNNNTSLNIPNMNQTNTNTANLQTPNTNQAVNQNQQNVDNKLVLSKLDDLNTLFYKSLKVQEDILTHTKMLA